MKAINNPLITNSSLEKKGFRYNKPKIRKKHWIRFYCSTNDLVALISCK